MLALIAFAFAILPTTIAFQLSPTKSYHHHARRTSLAQSSSSTSTTTSASGTSWFDSNNNQDDNNNENKSLEQLKVQILQLGAALDRGQAYNPTSGQYYSKNIKIAKSIIQTLVDKYPKPSTSIQDIEGEWELVLTTVNHGIFRSSPFFLAIQESYERFAEEKGTCLCVRCCMHMLN